MRKLNLKKETVAELPAADLGLVAGAAAGDVTKVNTYCFNTDFKVCLPTFDACFTTHGCA